MCMCVCVCVVCHILFNCHRSFFTPSLHWIQRISFYEFHIDLWKKLQIESKWTSVFNGSLFVILVIYRLYELILHDSQTRFPIHSYLIKEDWMGRRKCHNIQYFDACYYYPDINYFASHEFYGNKADIEFDYGLM